MNKNRIHPLINLAVIAFFVSIGIVTGMVIAPVKAQSTYNRIGFVDVQLALQSHPQYKTVMEQIQAFRQAKMNELADAQNAATTDEERSALAQKIYKAQDDISAEGKRLTDPLIQSVIDTTKSIGQESGIEVILEGGSVMYGGLDLTPLVVQKLGETTPPPAGTPQ